VVDGFAGWDERYRLNVRVVCARAYHALFMRNMLIRPSREELAHFHPDYVIYNAGAFPANRYTEGMTSATSVAINFAEKEIAILGTEYAGEMKKGILTVFFYEMPVKHGVLTMHSSANQGKDGDATLFFGLSGTGKTTLSADPRRALIGDDEHCWTDRGIFNVEGGVCTMSSAICIWNFLTGYLMAVLRQMYRTVRGERATDLPRDSLWLRSGKCRF
jgi:phosphoenolpyruvate carboxykinase (ATP)